MAVINPSELASLMAAAGAGRQEFPIVYPLILDRAKAATQPITIDVVRRWMKEIAFQIGTARAGKHRLQ